MKKTTSANNNNEGSDSTSFIYIRLNATYKLVFLIGLILGSYLIRYEFLRDVTNNLIVYSRGYEYNYEEDCILESPYGRKRKPYCRDPVDCSMCMNVTEIIQETSDLNRETFMEKYAYQGQPVVIKNVTHHWPAMFTFSFEYFRDLYEELNSPVLENRHEDCQFFAWDFKEFYNMGEVFDMPRSRFELVGDYDPWYVGWANCDPEAREILRDEYQRPHFLPEHSRIGKRDWFFIGTPGYGAPMHIDNVKLPSWQAQIKGFKEWKLSPPPECYWVCNGEMSTIQEPGDVIVVNTNWWFHSTRVLENGGLSITITNEYD